MTHSTTKYMDGHGAAVGGAIVDSGKFDWMAHADKYPGLCTPDESHIMELPMLRNSEKKAHLSQNVLLSLMRDFGSHPGTTECIYPESRTGISSCAYAKTRGERTGCCRISGAAADKVALCQLSGTSI